MLKTNNKKPVQMISERVKFPPFFFIFCVLALCWRRSFSQSHSNPGVDTFLSTKSACVHVCKYWNGILSVKQQQRLNIYIYFYFWKSRNVVTVVRSGRRAKPLLGGIIGFDNQIEACSSVSSCLERHASADYYIRHLIKVRQHIYLFIFFRSEELMGRV